MTTPPYNNIMNITDNGLIDFFNKQIPPEILVEIFELLPKSYLLEFITTNSRFNDYGCQILWRDRTLLNRRQFDAFVGTVCSKRTSRDYAPFVHCLRIDDNNKAPSGQNIHFRPQEFFLCIQNLSQLHTIHIAYDARYPQSYNDRFRFSQILQYCPALKEFYLSNFMPKAYNVIPGVLPKSSSLHQFATELGQARNMLTTFEICGSTFLATETMNALAANMPRLERLHINLSNNHLFTGTIPEASFIAFAENCPNLREIYLYGSSVCQNLTDNFYSKLAASCKMMETIEILSSQGITADGVKNILKECPYLKLLKTPLAGVEDQAEADKLFGKKVVLIQDDDDDGDGGSGGDDDNSDDDDDDDDDNDDDE